MAEGKKAEELSANQKIALVLAAMGADNASAVYKHLSDDEIEALSTEVAKLEYQPIDVVEGVLNEFYELCQSTFRGIPIKLPPYSTKMMRIATTRA